MPLRETSQWDLVYKVAFEKASEIDCDSSLQLKRPLEHESYECIACVGFCRYSDLCTAISQPACQGFIKPLGSLYLR